MSQESTMTFYVTYIDMLHDSDSQISAMQL